MNPSWHINFSSRKPWDSSIINSLLCTKKHKSHHLTLHTGLQSQLYKRLVCKLSKLSGSSASVPSTSWDNNNSEHSLSICCELDSVLSVLFFLSWVVCIYVKVLLTFCLWKPTWPLYITLIFKPTQPGMTIQTKFPFAYSDA